MIAKLESLFKNNIHEFKVRHYRESWMTSLGRTWLPGANRKNGCGFHLKLEFCQTQTIKIESLELGQKCY